MPPTEYHAIGHLSQNPNSNVTQCCNQPHHFFAHQQRNIERPQMSFHAVFDKIIPLSHIDFIAWETWGGLLDLGSEIFRGRLAVSPNNPPTAMCLYTYM